MREKLLLTWVMLYTISFSAEFIYIIFNGPAYNLFQQFGGSFLSLRFEPGTADSLVFYGTPALPDILGIASFIAYIWGTGMLGAWFFTSGKTVPESSIIITTFFAVSAFLFFIGSLIIHLNPSTESVHYLAAFFFPEWAVLMLAASITLLMVLAAKLALRKMHLRNGH